VNHARVRIVKTTARGLTKSSAIALPLIFGNHPAINRQSLFLPGQSSANLGPLDFPCPRHLHPTKNAIIGKTTEQDKLEKIAWKLRHRVHFFLAHCLTS
jgi:hypothetical protein